MSRDIYIHLITQYILIKPGRPFEEVQIYAEQIGASEEEIREAIFQVSTKLAEKKAQKKDIENTSHPLSDPFTLIDHQETPTEEIKVPNFLKNAKAGGLTEKLITDTLVTEPITISSKVDDKKEVQKSTPQLETFDKKVDEIITSLGTQQKEITKSAEEVKKEEKYTPQKLIIPGESTLESQEKDTENDTSKQHSTRDDKTVNTSHKDQKHVQHDHTKSHNTHKAAQKDHNEKVVASVKKKHRKFPFADRLPKVPSKKVTRNLLIAGFLGPLLVLTGSVLTYHTITNSPERLKNISGTTATSTANATDNKLGPPVVYASQKSIDANRLFSFPASDVTLKYTGRPQKEVFGFFPYWMLDAYDQVHIDSYTTIALFGLTSDSKGNIIASTGEEIDGGWAMWNDDRLDKFIARARKERIQVVLTVKSFNNDDIENLVLSDQAQKKFISNAVQLINLKSLDGINIDFEYIGTPDTAVTEGFTRLIANLNIEMKRQIPGSQLTIDTYLKSGGMRDLFDIQLLEEHVDAIVVMGYDVHTPNGTPGAVIPMEGPSSVVGFMQSYLERVSPKKLILALPYYGYDWPIKEEDREAHSPRAIPYAEIAAFAKETSITWDETTQTPSYNYTDPESQVSRIVHFENPRSLGLKYDYVNKKNLKGVGVWAMGYEGNNLELEQVMINKFAK
jgi:spore germination protein YaaH